MSNENTKFNIYIYDDYRVLLSELISWRKKRGLVFSYRWFSKMAEFSSPNFLKLVVDGKRDISNETIEKIAKVFKFNKKETEFFYNLVMFTQSKTLQEKDYYTEQILKLRPANIKILNGETFEYYSQWYHIPIREMITLSRFVADAHKISKQMINEVSESQVEEAIKKLEGLNLIYKDDQGKYIQKEKHLSTGDAFTSLNVIKFHRKMLELAALSIEKVPRAEREISSSTIGISKNKVQELKQLIQDFRQRLLQLSELDNNKEEVYQLNFQLFPLTRVLKEGAQ